MDYKVSFYLQKASLELISFYGVGEKDLFKERECQWSGAQGSLGAVDSISPSTSAPGTPIPHSLRTFVNPLSLHGSP